MVKKSTYVMLTVILLALTTGGRSQTENQELNVFGYFQVLLDNGSKSLIHPRVNSFSLQQMNLFLAKEISPSLSSFVNFEVTNSYSSDKNWGSFNLEEAWIKYRHGNEFNVKAGLLIPAFNNLNEINFGPLAIEEI